MGTAGFSVQRLPFYFFGESCQVLPMSDEARVEMLRVKKGRGAGKRWAAFPSDGCGGQGLGTKMGGWVRNAVECGKN